MAYYNKAAYIKSTIFVLMIAGFYPLSVGFRIYNYGYGSLSLTRHLPLTFVYLLAWRFIIKPYFFSPLRNLPTTRDPHFWMADGPGLLSGTPIIPYLLKCAKEVPNDGLILMRSFFHVGQVILLTTPEALMDVLNAHPYDYEKPRPARKLLSRTLGRGLIIVEGQEHKDQRKSVAAAFQGKHVKELVPIFWEKATHMAEIVASTISTSGTKTGTVDIAGLASRCTLDIIGKAGFNRDFGTLDNSDDELAQNYATITDPRKGNVVPYFVISMLPDYLASRIPWKMNRAIFRARVASRRMARQMVADRKAQLKTEEKSQSRDILSVLMRSGEISDETLVDQCLTFLAAGHETTAAAVTWSCYFLGLHQDVQSKLREELEAQLPATALSRDSDDFQMTAALIDSFPLLHGVCNETLRLYPTVPLTSRNAIRDTQILDQFVPKGVEVLISPWTINCLESLWGEDAATFRPSRWIGSDDAAAFGGAKNRAAFLTFIHGPRSCIGQGFARLEMKCLLAALVLRFRFELAEPDVKPIPGGTITIKPMHGMKLVMTETEREK